jgi:hypothetical protein
MYAVPIFNKVIFYITVGLPKQESSLCREGFEIAAVDP